MTTDHESFLLVASLRAYAELMSKFRDAAIFAQRLGVFSDASAHAVPQLVGQEPGTPAMSFFVDATLNEPTARGQTSIGASMEIRCRAGERHAMCDLGWEFGTYAGTGPALSWDQQEVKGYSEHETSRFLSALPGAADQLLARFRLALEEYANAPSGEPSAHEV